MMTRLNSKFAMAVALAAAALPPQEPTPESFRDLMLQAGGGLRHGVSQERGAFVVAVVQLERSDARGLADAREFATGMFSDWLGAEVSKESASSYSEEVTEDAVKVKSQFRTQTKVASQRMLAGIETLSLSAVDGESWMTFVLSERTAADATAIAAAARSKARGGKRKAVVAVGMAPLIEGAPGKSEVLATESAKRSALEMVVGVALAGMKFSRYEEDDDKQRTRFVDQVLSTTSGFLESFEVLERGAQGDAFLVRIRAIVSPRKALENYRSHLEVLGDPLFSIGGGEVYGLPALAAEFFRQKGFRIADVRSKADWEIILTPSFTPWQHPADGRSGQQCHLEVAIRNCRTGDLLAGVRTDGRASDFLGGGAPAQQTRSAKKAFHDAAERLQEGLTRSIVELARKGRALELRLVRVEGATFSLDDVDRIKVQLATLPGVKSVQARIAGPQLKLGLRSLLPIENLAVLFEDDLAGLFPEQQADVISLESEVVEWKLSRK